MGTLKPFPTERCLKSSPASHHCWSGNSFWQRPSSCWNCVCAFTGIRRCQAFSSSFCSSRTYLLLGALRCEFIITCIHIGCDTPRFSHKENGRLNEQKTHRVLPSYLNHVFLALKPSWHLLWERDCERGGLCRGAGTGSFGPDAGCPVCPAPAAEAQDPRPPGLSRWGHAPRAGRARVEDTA